MGIPCGIITRQSDDEAQEGQRGFSEGKIMKLGTGYVTVTG